LQKSVLRDCISMCIHICTINIRVSIRVRGLHLVLVMKWSILPKVDVYGRHRFGIGSIQDLGCHKCIHYIRNRPNLWPRFATKAFKAMSQEEKLKTFLELELHKVHLVPEARGPWGQCFKR
jgi:hypothetical protein